MGAAKDTYRAGRPREFDVDEALEIAVLVFWERGFAGASITDLTAAMGISRKSMYAAFGNKEELFEAALARYTEGPAAYAARALRQSTARSVATEFLAGCVHATTRPAYPAGCMAVQGALVAGETARPAYDALVAWRDEGRDELRKRFEQATIDGDLTPATSPALLARYVITVANGIAVQASGGAERDELQAVADAAVRHWPPV